MNNAKEAILKIENTYSIRKNHCLEIQVVAYHYSGFIDDVAILHFVATLEKTVKNDNF